MARRDLIKSHVEHLLRTIGKADISDLEMHKNTLRATMAKRLDREVELRGSELRCEPDKKRPGGSSKTIGGED